MINQCSNTNLSFKGNISSGLNQVVKHAESIAFDKASLTEHSLELLDSELAARIIKLDTIPTNTLQAYTNLSFTPPKIRLERKFFAYGTKDSTAIKPYSGPKNKTAGLSTEGDGLGGGWVEADLNTPLSTEDPHTCAVVNLVNKQENKHFLWHVFHGTTQADIEKFIKTKFSTFETANIIPGDQYQTEKTVNKIANAIGNINKEAEINYYHMSTERPEIVAHRNDLGYIPNKKDKLTFQEEGNNFQ